DAFLPIGYPNSVARDYLSYQTFDSLQAFFSTITSLLANRAILQGLGVGDASSSATYALLLTILKDAVSRVATIVFAYRFGLSIEPDAKRYRFLADLFNDSAFFLDLASPYLGVWAKIAALTCAEALRALCGVAAGASKAALSNHFARNNNLAELNAKEASQETAVGLIGLLAGSVIVHFVESREAVFALMILLVFVHLWMNYLGVCCVQLETLNRQRTTILVQHYLSTGQVLTPAQVAQRENIVFWAPFIRNKDGVLVAHVTYARSFREAMPDGYQPTIYGNAGFRLIVWRPSGRIVTMKILLSGDKEEEFAALEAWILAVRIAWNLGRKGGGDTRAGRIIPRLRTGGWRLDEHGFETGTPIR
ncbi:hypothetical protein ACRALDRAFT_2088242, partial [Sodiomyces alcalophilus JCM 7366]|uniref:uncharacterized protein n=1 Tax=Sodiomyces alcalophilus JCM 7366 TaxID=591952 RepID=UPI0039B63F6D